MLPKTPHDPLNPYDNLRYELMQRRESGYDTSGLEVRFVALPDASVPVGTIGTGPDADQVPAIEELYAELLTVPRREDWAYVEPEALEDIAAGWGPDTSEPVVPTEWPPATRASRSRAGRRRRCASCWSGTTSTRCGTTSP